MIHRKSVLAAGSALTFWIVAAFAQGDDGKLAERSAPAGLESYADTAIVLQNARRVVGVLGTAKFDVNASGDEKRDTECNSEEVQSFNRGYVLAHTGFNMFLALQETGFTDLAGPNRLAGEKHRRFVQFGRSALLAAWKPKQIGQLIDLRGSLRSLPASTKADLATFLTKLGEYRLHYTRLKAAKPELLEDLFRRENDAYYWYHAYIESNATKDAETFSELLKQMPKGVSYSELSETLDKELREVSDVAKNDPHACFIQHLGLVISYPSEKLNRDYNPIYATKYMVGFWRRRAMEGTSELADFAIQRVLDALRAK